MEQPNFEVVGCPRCGARNRVPLHGSDVVPKCGKCGSPIDQRSGKNENPYLLRCTECGAKNKIPAERIQQRPVCGKCRSPLKTEELFAPQPLMITEPGFQKSVLQSPLPVLVFAWAPWCTTCRAFMPVIDEFAREVKGRIRVGKLNVDQAPNLSSQYAIMSVPQIFVFDGGRLLENFPGALQRHELRLKMARFL